jgi:hypothetical protein
LIVPHLRLLLPFLLKSNSTVLVPLIQGPDGTTMASAEALGENIDSAIIVISPEQKADKSLPNL